MAKKEDWDDKFEEYVDKSIPPCLIVLAVLIIIDLVFKDIAHKYHTAIIVIDTLIIFIFILDLIFKYSNLEQKSQFVKKYWLDMLACIPFYWIFRFIEPFVGATELTGVSQKVLHEGLNVEKFAKFEKAAKFERTLRMTRYFRPLARIPRFVKAFTAFEKNYIEKKSKSKSNVRVVKVKKKSKKSRNSRR